jgi:hypothetical protein
MHQPSSCRCRKLPIWSRVVLELECGGCFTGNDEQIVDGFVSGFCACINQHTDFGLVILFIAMNLFIPRTDLLGVIWR